MGAGGHLFGASPLARPGTDPGRVGRRPAHRRCRPAATDAGGPRGRPRVGAGVGGPHQDWYADPSGLHRQRWWDGATWTAWVVDGAAPYRDDARPPPAG